MINGELDLFAAEFTCFHHYLRAVLHLRPVVNVKKAWIEIGGEKIALAVHNSGDYVVLSCDALIPGITEAHDAAVCVQNGLSKVCFRDFVQSDLPGHDAVCRITERVHASVMGRISDLDVLELGSRNRQNTKDSWNNLRRNARRYVGVDILAGPNVDVVGDAHQLSTLVPHNAFDFIYTQWVFEHLAMPWVVCAEINRVLRIGGEAFILTNHTIGLHDLPWDFWRFSESAFIPLFNEQTGFEIIESGLGEGMRITPMRYHRGHIEHEGGLGYQSAACWVRKTAERYMTWPVDPTHIATRLSREYPVEITD